MSVGRQGGARERGVASIARAGCALGASSRGNSTSLAGAMSLGTSLVARGSPSFHVKSLQQSPPGSVKRVLPTRSQHGGRSACGRRWNQHASALSAYATPSSTVADASKAKVSTAIEGVFTRPL